MRDLKAGLIIKSTDALIDSIFEDTTILIVKHDNEGTTGFVTNKPLHKSLHELIEFNHSKPYPLMDGGPVDKDHLSVHLFSSCNKVGAFMEHKEVIFVNGAAIH